jgi:hypoxanthine phosphoribosyltransferase
MELERARQAHETAELLFDAKVVNEAIAELAARIERDHGEDYPLLLCVMNGGMYLTGQLLRHWEFPLTLDYLHATRYRLATLGKTVLWKAYPQNEIRDRSVIIVDDIFDQGYTLEEVTAYCLRHGARQCSSVFLVRKTHDRKTADVLPDYHALECGDCFVYGAGMDLNGHFRNLSAIYSLPEKVE